MFKLVKILLFFLFDSQLTGLIQNFKIKQNSAISKHFTKPHCVHSYNQWNYFQCGTTSGTIFSADVWINGGQVNFQYKPGAYL